MGQLCARPFELFAIGAAERFEIRRTLERDLARRARRKDEVAIDVLDDALEFLEVGALVFGRGDGTHEADETDDIAREIEEGGRRLAKLDKQITARARALPLFRAVVESEDLAPALRGQRQHPVHTLLRRLYHEG